VSVYVDTMQAHYRGMIMCHMLADSLEELHAMADKIGVARKWFQPGSTPHYDICRTKIALAIIHGAIVADRKKVVSLIRFWRANATT